MEKKIEIIKAESDNPYILGRFDTGYDIKFEDIDSEWFVETKPKNSDEEIQIKRKYANKYKNYKPPKDTVWFLHSQSGRYFRETIDTNSTQLFYLSKSKNGKFEAYPIEQQHVFRPITKPKFKQSEEERADLMKRAKEVKIRKKNVQSNLELMSIINDSATDSKFKYDDDEKGEGFDFDEQFSDDEEGEITMLNDKKDLSNEAKELKKLLRGDNETKNIKANKTVLGKRKRGVKQEIEEPPLKKVKTGTELTKDNLYDFIASKGKVTLNEIRTHFRKSGTKKEKLEFIKGSIQECAKLTNDNCFIPNPNYKHT